jgi:hypothetical protein
MFIPEIRVESDAVLVIIIHVAVVVVPMPLVRDQQIHPALGDMEVQEY